MRKLILLLGVALILFASCTKKIEMSEVIEIKGKYFLLEDKSTPLTGTITDYFPNGKTRFEIEVVDGLYSGKYKSYWDNGELKLELEYDQGKVVKFVEAYDKDNAKFCDCNTVEYDRESQRYINLNSGNLMDGICISFYDNGLPMIIETYRAGAITKEWSFYDNGFGKELTIFGAKLEPISYKDWNENGNILLKVDACIDGDLIHAKAYTWHDKDLIKSVEHINEDETPYEYHLWHENGKKQAEYVLDKDSIKTYHCYNYTSIKAWDDSGEIIYDIDSEHDLYWFIRCHYPVSEHIHNIVSNLSQFTDERDGTIYHAIKIGDQTWMAENLNYPTESGSYFYEDNYSFFRLYNWQTANNACPDGWRLPSKSDFQTLLSFVENDYSALSVFGSSGFSAYLCGRVRPLYCGDFIFEHYNRMGYYWSSTPTSDYNHTDSYKLQFYSTSSGTLSGCYGRLGNSYYYSVRCIKEFYEEYPEQFEEFDKVANEKLDEPIEEVILKMYSKPGEIFDQKCESRVLICIKSGIVKSVGIDCECQYSFFNYYAGKIIDLKSQGKAYLFDNCGGGGGPGDPTMCMHSEEFTMQFSSDSTKLKYIYGMNFSISKLKYNFKTKGLKIFETPSFRSEIKEVLKSNDLSIELIEIGNLEKKDGEWDIWYKVKSNTIEGWVYGNLYF